MTPKEKAQELLDKLYNTEHCHKKHTPNNKWCDCSEMNMFQARQCAMICVDEILTNIEATILYHKESVALPLNKEYWQEVKQELEKL